MSDNLKIDATVTMTIERFCKGEAEVVVKTPGGTRLSQKQPLGRIRERFPVGSSVPLYTTTAVLEEATSSPA